MQHQYEVQPVKRDQEADSGEATIDEIGRLPLISQVTTLIIEYIWAPTRSLSVCPPVCPPHAGNFFLK